MIKLSGLKGTLPYSLNIPLLEYAHCLLQSHHLELHRKQVSLPEVPSHELLGHLMGSWQHTLER